MGGVLVCLVCNTLPQHSIDSTNDVIFKTWRARRRWSHVANAAAVYSGGGGGLRRRRADVLPPRRPSSFYNGRLVADDTHTILNTRLAARRVGR